MVTTNFSKEINNTEILKTKLTFLLSIEGLYFFVWETIGSLASSLRVSNFFDVRFELYKKTLLYFF